MKVLHGTGKPRILIATPTIHTNEVGSADATSVTLANAVDLTALNNSHTLKNRRVVSSSGGNATLGVIVSFDDDDDILTVVDWSNGTPDVGQPVNIGSIIIDLPYCLSLIEMWTPDFILKKMFSGKLRVWKKGYYYSAMMDYSRFVDGTLLADLAPLYKVHYDTIFFYPRRDNQTISYEVDLSPDTRLTLAQARAHSGHRLVRIELIGIRRLTEINLTLKPETPHQGYGTDYGSGYGTGL